MHGWDSLMASPPAGPVPQSLTTHHRNWLLRLITLAPAVANAASLPFPSTSPPPLPFVSPHTGRCWRRGQGLGGRGGIHAAGRDRAPAVALEVSWRMGDPMRTPETFPSHVFIRWCRVQGLAFNVTPPLSSPSLVFPQVRIRHQRSPRVQDPGGVRSRICHQRPAHQRYQVVAGA